MYDHFRLLNQYLIHRIGAANSKGHGVHSPFFFDFIQQVLPDTGHQARFDKPEQYRALLREDPTRFERTDLGAGSKKKSNLVTVRSMANRSMQQAKWARLLYRIIRYYQPGPVLELGTSFGVTTEYLSLADEQQAVYTLEGDPFIARRASSRFQQDDLKQIKLIEGNFDDTLPVVLQRIGPVGFVYLDGNHRKEPTLRYVEQLIPHLHNDSILVLDDIYWSASMQAAWQTIQLHRRVTATIDLFRIGIVLFRKEFHQKSHIRLRY